MKNVLFSTILFLVSSTCFGQNSFDSLLTQADSNYFDFKDYEQALSLYSKASEIITEDHKDYGYTIDKMARSIFYLESNSREQYDTDNSIKYSKEFIQLADKHPSHIDAGVLAKKYFMVKNLIVAYFEKEDLATAKKYQDQLYKAYKKGDLPEGIDHFYNFEFFKWEDKNIWGYEWYKKIPKDRLSSSFTKIIYYIYSTNPDGTDKDQLYRLHVLMFHKTDNSTKFDYVLTKKVEKENSVVGGTLYDYTYKDPIDYVKLRKDIREILKKNPEPDVGHYRKK